MNTYSLILTILAAIFGYGLIRNGKKRASAEALLENQETKKQLQEQDKKQDQNSNKLELEEQKREEIKTSPKSSVSTDDLVKFFNGLDK